MDRLDLGDRFIGQAVFEGPPGVRESGGRPHLPGSDHAGAPGVGGEEAGQPLTDVLGRENVLIPPQVDHDRIAPNRDRRLDRAPASKVDQVGSHWADDREDGYDQRRPVQASSPLREAGNNNLHALPPSKGT